jgi:hypothetical protein
MFCWDGKSISGQMDGSRHVIQSGKAQRNFNLQIALEPTPIKQV